MVYKKAGLSGMDVLEWFTTGHDLQEWFTDSLKILWVSVGFTSK